MIHQRGVRRRRVPGLMPFRSTSAAGAFRYGAVIACLAFLLCTWLIPPASAHEVRPAYLRIQQQSETQYDFLWRVPARGEMRLSLYVELPPGCEEQGERRAWREVAYSRHTRPNASV